MKPFKHLRPLLFAFLFAAGCAPATVVTAPPQTGSPAPSAPGGPSDGAEQAEALLMPPAFEAAVEMGTRTTTGVPGPRYWQQDASYTITTRVDAEEKRLEGTGRVVYTNNSPDTLYTLHMELVQNVHHPSSPRNESMETTEGVVISRITIDGQPLQNRPPTVPLSYGEYETQLIMAPARPLAPGRSATIEVDWAFEIPRVGASGRMGYSGEDLLYLAYWYPVMSVYDDVEGWFTDPFVGTAEFYYGFGDYDVTIDAPAGWVVYGTGALQNADETLAPAVAARMREAHASDRPLQILQAESYRSAVTRPGQNGRVRWRFTADDVRDFAFAVMRNYVWDGARTSVGDRDGDGDEDFTAINAFYRPTAPLWARVAEYEQHAITFLSGYTAQPYPWPHMTAVEGAGIIGGGMEYPMMTLMGSYNSAGAEALYNVTAHELAHMWLPMIVASNERRYAWMDEGSTSFAENQARTDRAPGRNHNLGELQGYLETARSGLEGEIMRRSDYHYSGAAYGNATYSKPATLLVTLRALLGEETFNRAYREYIDAWAYKHPYPYDLFNTFERVSGRDLDWFWQPWYFETATLDHAVALVNAGTDGTDITITNLGEAPLPTRLRITLENGQTLEREVPVEHWLSGATEATVTVPAGSAVQRVVIDPGLVFPDINRENNVWER